MRQDSILPAKSASFAAARIGCDSVVTQILAYERHADRHNIRPIHKGKCVVALWQCCRGRFFEQVPGEKLKRACIALTICGTILAGRATQKVPKPSVSDHDAQPLVLQRELIPFWFARQPERGEADYCRPRLSESWCPPLFRLRLVLNQ